MINPVTDSSGNVVTGILKISKIGWYKSINRIGILMLLVWIV